MAIKIQSTRVAENPKNDLAYQNCGFAKLAMGQLGSTATDFTIALEINPKLMTARFHCENLRRACGQFAEAIADDTIAIEHEPELLLAIRLRAESLQQME